ncbi:Uncharacterized protein At3g49140 [Linum grandiflorum]
MNNTTHSATDVLSSRYGNRDFRSRSFPWSCGRRDLTHMKVAVAADYSDSFSDSYEGSYTSARGYHPLEEVKASKITRQPQLTSAEIARTTVENAFIGMDVPIYENKRVASEYNVFNVGGGNNIPFDEDFFQVKNSFYPLDWGMPDTCSWIHPLHFAKCLTKAIDMEHNRKLVHPSNGVSIVGCLRPAFDDEQSYFRSVIHCEDSDEYNSDSEDGDILNSSSKREAVGPRSTVYRLEIMSIELFSVYGTQTTVGLLDFQDAEPDVLLNSISAILERFNDRGINCDVALKTLCKKRGIDIEQAHLIGVDSLGLDVRVSSGVEVRTHRFPFKARARSEISAEKQIHQLLFPRSRRKRRNNGLRESRSH